MNGNVGHKDVENSERKKIKTDEGASHQEVIARL